MNHFKRFSALGVFALMFSACTLLGVGRKTQNTRRDTVQKKEAAAKADPDSIHQLDADETDESGVQIIARLIRDFNKALRKKLFQEATAMLKDAQRRVRKASAITRSHPDFEDVQLVVRESANRLDVAMEVDRIQRRNAAIADLIGRGDSAQATANRLYAELSKRPPTADDIEKLNGAIDLFNALRNDGADFLDDERYAGHADDRDEKMKVLRKLRTKVQWQVGAATSISALIEAAYSAGIDALNSKDPEAQVRSLIQSKVSFKACATAIGDLRADRDYDKNTILKTRLGKLGLTQTREKCLSLSKQAGGRVGFLTWSAKISAMVKSLNAAWAQMRSPRDEQSHYALTVKSADVLSRCLLVLDKTERKPGYKEDFVFETLLGKHTARNLRTACKKERTALVKTLPQLKWRTRLHNLRTGIDRLHSLLKKAETEDVPGKRVILWDRALAGLKECVAKAAALGKNKGADKTFKVKTAFGEISIGQVEKICAKRKPAAAKALDDAIKRKEVEEFAVTTRGEEKDVVRREGIPSRIEAFRGGRIFIYETPSKTKGQNRELRRFGFDREGKRVDYWVKWRNDMVHLVSELSLAMKNIRDAKDAKQSLKATKAAAPVLTVCLESIRSLKKSPGYDASAIFTTPFGRLVPKKIGPMCAKEKQRLRASESTVAWHARLEALRDRLVEADDSLTQAKKITNPNERLQLLSAAVGGLTECVERAAAMPSQRGTDLKYKVPTNTGKLNIQGLSKLCLARKAEAKEAANKAHEEKRIAKFVKSCKGDEIEVAIREGVPDKIETLPGGRVFIYNSKRKKRRIAFNKAGKRVDEGLLKP